MSQSVGTNSTDAGVVTVSRTGDVTDATRVRHFDQLDERTQSALLEARSESRIRLDETDLLPGEVVVFTEYLRVSR